MDGDTARTSDYSHGTGMLGVTFFGLRVSNLFLMPAGVLGP